MRFQKLLVCVATVFITALSTEVSAAYMKQSTQKFLSESGVFQDEVIDRFLPKTPENLLQDFIGYVKKQANASEPDTAVESFERIFSTFDDNKNDFLDYKEF